MTNAALRVDLLVIGGGIGGLATALALARHGLQVHVLEQAPDFGEIGAGVQLAPNALRVLDRLGALDAVLAHAVAPPSAVLMNAMTGEPITTLDFGASFRSAYSHPYIVTHRSDLLDAILSACRSEPVITLEVGKRAVTIREQARRMIVECADGSAYEAEALIGADGVWSAVRGYTVGDGPPAYVGDVAYRGAIPIDAISARAGRENITWWIGPGMHLIQYPVRGGELFNQVAVLTADPTGNPDDWGAPAELERAFAGTTHHVGEGIRLINRDRRWVLRDRPPVPTWTKGRATLLGDAAHPMVQYLAQGACQALEDAVVLADCLAEHGSAVEAAFAAYEAERQRRTAQVQVWGRRMGEIVHADGVTALLRDELLMGRDPAYLRYVDWLYAYRPPIRNPATVRAS